VQVGSGVDLPQNELLHLSGAMLDEAITTEPLEVQTKGGLAPAFKKSPAGERGVLRTNIASRPTLRSDCLW
jgi:hypothetical protein